MARGGGEGGQRRRSDLLDEVPPAQISTRDLLIDPLDNFLHDYHAKTRLNRQVLEHLLHGTFAAGAEGAEPEADLVLDPLPEEATVRAVLGRYPFRDVAAAYRNLTHLAAESVPFLSTRRCRHFLASIAGRLLQTIAATPDPDAALTNLEKVTASLGAKAVLWELFSVHPPSLKLYVDLCAHSQFLTDLLVGNPGMIDELLDSLVLNRPRTLAELRVELVELCRGAADPEPILHSFQDKELLRIGVRDLLGKDNVRATTAALSDLAEAVLGQLWRLAELPLVERHGAPRLADGTPSRAVLLALGKLGGREMSYHSDLDLVLIYEGGSTANAPTTDNLHYYTELARRLIRSASAAGPLGRLYQVDMRLRPAGQAGTLAVALDEFTRYYQGLSAGLWERQSLTRARVVAGDPDFAAAVETAVRTAAYGPAWRPEMVEEVRAMRARLEASARPLSLKRGSGGLVDVEFAVQLLLLKYGATHPEVCRPNVWEALNALHSVGLSSAEDDRSLREGYGFLRQVESRLRIVTNRALTELPEAAEDLEKLARRLGYDPAGGLSARERFVVEWEQTRREVRAAFLRVCDRERG